MRITKKTIMHEICERLPRRIRNLTVEEILSDPDSLRVLHIEPWITDKEILAVFRKWHTNTRPPSKRISAKSLIVPLFYPACDRAYFEYAGMTIEEFYTRNKYPQDTVWIFNQAQEVCRKLTLKEFVDLVKKCQAVYKARWDSIKGGR